MISPARVRAILILTMLLPVGAVRAQPAGDQAINQIRRLTNIGANDQRQIKNWIERQVTGANQAGRGDRPDGMNVAAFKTFRDAVLAQIGNAQNTDAFLAQFAAQLAAVAGEQFRRPDGPTTVRRALARALVDISRVETVPGLIVGLGVTDQPTRYLCAQGLVLNRTAIAADANLMQQVVQALSQAGQTESDGFVVGRMYDALALPNAVGTTLPVYLQLFDARLERRKARGSGADPGELAAYEYLRAGALSGLNADQRTELAKRLAVFLRLDAERYNDPSLAPPSTSENPDRAFIERDVLERRLDGAEDLLAQLVGSGKGGDIRSQLNTSGFAARATVVQEAYKWVGNADQSVTGALNAAPWNVPVGAP